jgi:hypothetical protein
MEDVIKLLKLSHVPRWSIVDTIKGQSVADHTYRTTVIFMHLVEKLDISDMLTWPDCIIDVLKHDMEEAFTGDMPTTHKKQNGELSVPHSPAQVLLKIADCVEAYIFAYRYAVIKENVVLDVRNNIDRHVKTMQEILDKSGWGFEDPRVGTVVNQLIWAGVNYD